MSRGLLPSLPRDLRGCLHQTPKAIASCSGASGPFWIVPAGVLRPTHPDQLSSLLAWASTHRVPLTPRGAGTGMPAGNIGPHLVLDLSGLPGRIEINPDARTVSAPASAVAADLNAAARPHGLHLPALPSSARWCTVGGMVACNAAGARSLRHGSTADWLESADWLDPRGEPGRVARSSGSSAARSGSSPDGLGGGPDRSAGSPDPSGSATTRPRINASRHGSGERWERLHASISGRFPDGLPWPAVIKNSSGYLLDRWLPSGSPLDLISGSEGTLVVITEVTLRLAAQDAQTQVVILGLPDLGALVDGARLAREIGASACEYFGRALIDLGGLGADPRLSSLRADGGMLLVEVAGTPTEVDAMATALRDWARASGGIVEARNPTEAEALWGLRHEASPRIMKGAGRGRRSIQFIEDCVVPPQALGTYVERLEQILLNVELPAVIFGHAAQGNLHVNPLVNSDREGWREQVAEVLRATVDLVAELGGTLAGEHGDGRLRAPWLHRFHTPDVMSAFQEIKDTLDPSGILNPGVILPGAAADPLKGLTGLGEAPDFRDGSRGPERVPS